MKSVRRTLFTAALLGAAAAFPCLAANQEALDGAIKDEIDLAYKDINYPLAKLVASALMKATPSPMLDDVDRKILDFPPQDLTDVTDMISQRFAGERRINEAMRQAYVAHGGGKAGAYAASQAQGMQALSEVYRQEAMRREKAEKRRGVIRFRFDYKVGEWALATDQNAQDPTDQILMARAVRRTLESNPSQVNDDKREKSVLSYAAALVGTTMLPFGKQQLLGIFDEAQGWYDTHLAAAPAGRKKKLAEHNLAGCLAFLSGNLKTLDPAEGERVGKRIVDAALLAEDRKLYDDAIYSLEHRGQPSVNNRIATMEPDEAFLIAGLYQEAIGNKAQALDIYRAYEQDYAGFSLKYKAYARYLDLFSQKAAKLAAELGGKAGAHVNRNWGVHADDMKKAEQAADNDKKRKAGGLDWD